MSARVAPRRPAAKCPWVTGLRMDPPGGDVALVDLSWSGLKARSKVRVRPGTGVSIRFEGTLTPNTVQGRVARCEVGGIGTDGLIHYLIGIVFNEPISLPDDDAPPAGVQAAGAETPEPVVENRW